MTTVDYFMEADNVYRTNKIHPNTPFRKQQELKDPQKRKHPPQTAKHI